ncbi:MAG: immunoglobulin-like domain-containing protein [Patescibacteria group bacterium]
MKKTLRKFLIYLLATGMLMPTWMVTGMMSATHAKAADPSTPILDPVLSEIYVNEADEWVEFYNPNSSNVDLSGIKIKTSINGTNSDVFVINPNTIVSANSLRVLTDSDFDKPLLFSDLTGILQLFGSISYARPDGTAVQPDATYTKGGDVAKRSAYSLQFDIATSTWGSATKTEGIYDAKELAINITTNPISSISNLDYTVTIDYLNAQTKLFMIEEDGAVLYDWQNYASPVSLSTEGQYVVRAEAINSIGENEITETSFTIDKTKPVITLTGEDNVTAEVGSTYADAGATATDNIDGDISGNIVTDDSLVNTTTIGDYAVTYNVTDAAGNAATQVTKTVHVIEKVLSVLSPDFTLTTLEGKNFRVEWTGNGADSYIVKVNGNADPNGAVLANTTEQYSRDITVSEYGVYDITLVAVKGGVESTDFKNHSIELKATVAATTQATTSTSVEAAPATISVGPAKAEAAASQEEQKVETSADDSNGQIKGDETSSQDEEEKVNWTPWIVLFVLIILAGAATGGYFYWFNGEDEVKAVVKEPKKESSSAKATNDKEKKVVSKSNNKKKQKRW